MNKKITKWFYVVLILGLCIILCSAQLSVTQQMLINNEQVTDFSKDWHYSVNDSTVKEGPITLPYRIKAHKNDHVYLHNTLPSLYPEGMTICFRSSSQFVRVLVGGQEVYQFGYSDVHLFGRSPGSAWHFIRLQKGTAGSDLVIELTSPYEAFSGITMTVYYGSKNANVFHIFRENLPSFFISTVIVLIGLLLFIVYAFARRNAKTHFLLYLAWFSLLSGLWSMAESRIPQFFINNQFAVMLCSFSALMLLPIPLLLFITETHSFHNKKPFSLLAILFLVNFVVLMGLQIFNLVDLMESLFITQLLMLASIVFFIGSILREVFYYKNRDIYVLGFGTSVFICITLLDFLRYQLNRTTNNSFFFRFAVLFYILVLVYHTVKLLLDMMAQNLYTDTLEQLAFHDLLTDLNNRTAFEKAMEPYRMDVTHCKKLCIGIFDINNLKLVNDTQGHKAGDDLLISAVHCLKATFAEHGQLYRIGGDEFALLTEGLSPDVAAALLQHFEQEVAHTRQEQHSALSVAYGIARFDPKLDKTADELYVRADSYMYETKHKIKQT